MPFQSLSLTDEAVENSFDAAYQVVNEYQTFLGIDSVPFPVE
jgi:hypothetical protein